MFIPTKSEDDHLYDQNNGKIVSLSRVMTSMYVIHINKSEDDHQYDQNNGKIVSLSRVMNSMYVIHINVRIIGFLISNTFGTALKIISQGV